MDGSSKNKIYTFNMIFNRWSGRNLTCLSEFTRYKWSVGKSYSPFQSSKPFFKTLNFQRPKSRAIGCTSKWKTWRPLTSILITFLNFLCAPGKIKTKYKIFGQLTFSRKAQFGCQQLLSLWGIPSLYFRLLLHYPIHECGALLFFPWWITLLFSSFLAYFTYDFNF